jgi:tRNA-2-methylthio-N6-dimethylallyladenosine synthase
MNEHDSEKLAGVLEDEGYRPAAGVADADLILLNTCSIREKAAEKVFAELGRLKPLKDANPHLVLGVCGCVAQQEGAAVFRRAPYVDFVLGPRATGTLAVTLARLRRGDRSARHTVDTEYRSDSIEFPVDRIRRRGEGTGRAFITLIEGCNHRCTYCIVPRTRGREVCRDMDGVLDEVRSLAGRGVVEIEFLGQTVNAYRDTAGRTLGDLLLAASRIEGIRRLRFTTSHPAQMTERLMDAMREASPIVCPYLHLPAQSGSSRVLGDMRRGYDREGYLRKVEGLRRRIPEISLGTDLIVGFPTETVEDFGQTLSLLDEVGFDTVYSFVYSPRPGTAAEGLADPVPGEIKLSRLAELQGRQRAIQERRLRGWVVRETEVLVEGPSKRAGRQTGRTPDHRLVHFEGQVPTGTLARVRITDATALSLRGVLLPGAGPRETVYHGELGGARNEA